MFNHTRKYPVGIQTFSEIRLAIMEKDYGKDETEVSPGMRLAGLIQRAWQKTGRQTVVIIDEYDAPLLDGIP
ncbi:MAG: AAA family ATPase [Bacteroidales bacterium]|nr:AAA family ATPase [Bacteroidales bacterium]